VRDTGPGIAPNQLERIFQPFEQAGELRRRAEGAGLGLAISRQLVQLMGGELHVDSELGCGSTFWFAVVLPVVAAAVAPASERPIIGYTDRRRTLLVVDDVESNRALLVAMLAPLGFTVHVAADGRQAVALAQQLRPDLILIDWQMPVLSGPDAVRQIRQIRALRDVPIIATSASVSAADQAMSHAAGCDNFLPKPIRLPELAALLERHLQLEWVYATDMDLAETVGAVGTTEASDLPSAEELAALFELAQFVDVFAIQARAAQIEQREVRWRAFAQRVAQLAGQFEVEQILALLAPYLPPDPQV
jgi:CheY-like chemotaxis protein